ncbi:hypothetical protein K435DRAFT_657175, partial [Dendrothele bispora CBS 962.96]
LIPQLTRLCKTMSPRWNDQFSREIFKLRDAQIEVAKYRSLKTTYIPLRRRFSGIGIIFCFVEALEGLELDDKRENEENDRDLEKMKELVGDVIGLAWDVFSFKIDQSISFDPFNIVNVLVQSKHGRSLGAAIHQTGNIVKAKFEEYERVERGLVRRCKEEVSGVSSLLKRLWGTGTSSKRGVGLGGLSANVYSQSSKNTNANSKDVEEGRYTNSALTDLSLYLLGLKDCLVGSLNWAYETEMFFGTKGDSVRGYGWVFLLPRDEE